MTEHVHHMMDRQIFNLHLSVEATSAYILITSLVGDNLRPTLDIVKGRWTSDEDALNRALEELVQRQVISLQIGPDEITIYYPNPASLWK